MEKEEKGQFPSKDCECHWDSTYGFVPEADCIHHDDKQFLEFVEYTERKGWQRLARQIESTIAEFGDNPEAVFGIIDETINGRKEEIY